MRRGLHETIIPTDRWSARAVSPVNISSGIDTDQYGPVVIVHPGWAKAPERLVGLLQKLANNGHLPIGIDTRWAYADRQQPRKRLLLQPMVVGKQNPYFGTDTRADNRWQYRRPTAVLEVLKTLGVERRSYIGHSDGGRIVTLAATVTPEMTDRLILVNAAGTGDSNHGMSRMTRANLNRVKEMAEDTTDLPAATISALGSVVYTLTHPRRVIGEKQVLQRPDTWSKIDLLEGKAAVTVFHAQDDEVISYHDSAQNALTRPWVDFISTEGGHSNIYHPGIQNLIIEALD